MRKFLVLALVLNIFMVSWADADDDQCDNANYGNDCSECMSCGGVPESDNDDDDEDSDNGYDEGCLFGGEPDDDQCPFNFDNDCAECSSCGEGSCKGDANATYGCDMTCSKICPTSLNPTKCTCPEKSCMCKDGYYYNFFLQHCVLPEDCDMNPDNASTFGMATAERGCSSYPNAEPGCDSKCERRCPIPNSYYKKYDKCRCSKDSCRCKKGYKFDYNKYMCVLASKCTVYVSDDNEDEQCENNCGQSCSCGDVPESDADDDDEDCENDFDEGCLFGGGSCMGDANATCGCDMTCSKICPSSLNPTKCTCPEKSCMCKDGYYYNFFLQHCVLPEDCDMNPDNASTFGMSTAAKECSSYPNAESGCDSKCERLCPNPNSYYKKYDKCGCSKESCRCKKGYKFDFNKYMCVLGSKCTVFVSDDNEDEQFVNGCGQGCSCGDDDSNETTLDCDDDNEFNMPCSCSCEPDYGMNSECEDMSSTTEDTTDEVTNTTEEFITTTEDTTVTTDEVTSTTEEFITTTEAAKCPDAVSRMKKTLCRISPKILYELVKMNPLKTVSISVLTVSNLLGLYKTFTYGKTNAEIEKVLPLNNDELVCVFKILKDIVKSLPSGSYETGKVVAVDNQYRFTKKFKIYMDDIIEGEAINVDTHNLKETAETINKELASQTDGTFTNVTSPEKLRNRTMERLLCLCAEYSELLLQIPSCRKEMRDFLVGPFNIIVRPYLCQSVTLNYIESAALQSKIVEIPVSIGTLVIVLPNSRLGAKDVIKIMVKNPCLVEEEIKKAKLEMVDLCIPLFDSNTFSNITDVMEKTKLAPRLLSPKTSQLRNVVYKNKPLGVTVGQKCITKMSTEGTQTTTKMPTNPSQKEYKVDCSHPFIFMTIVGGFIDIIGLVGDIGMVDYIRAK